MGDRLAVIQSDATISELEKVKKAVDELVPSFIGLDEVMKNISKGYGKGTPKEYEESIKRTKTLKLNLIDINAKIELAEKKYEQQLQANAKVLAENNLRVQQATKANKEYAAEKIRLENLSERERQRLGNTMQLYKSVEAKLQKLQFEYRNLAVAKEMGMKLSEKEIQRMDTLKGRIEKYDTTLKAVDATMGKHTRHVGNYERANNGLGMSLAQITREFPAFANSAQTGFMALSNNIPIFFDAIGQVKNLNKELQAQGKPTVSVLKQLAGALFSWQTLLSVGVTLLTVYGDDILEWTQTLFKGKSSVDGLKNAIKDLNEVKIEANKNSSKELVNFEMNYRMMKDENVERGMRLKLAKDMQEMYPKIFGNMSTEQMLLGNTTKQYNELRDAIYSAAMAEAVKNKISEAQSKFLDDEQQRLDNIGKRKIKIQNLKTGKQVSEIVNSQGVITQFGTKGAIREEEMYLKQDRINRELAIKNHKAYLDKMYNIGQKYQIKGDKADNPDKGKNPKEYTSSKLTGEQKDAIDLANAWRDNELTKAKEQKIKLEITEEEYWKKYLKIYQQYRDKIIKILDGSNAKEKAISAAVRKKAVDELEKANKEIYDLQTKANEANYKKQKEALEHELDLIKENGFMYESSKLESQIRINDELTKLTEEYYAKQIELAKQNNESTLGIEADRDKALNNLYENRLKLSANIFNAYEKDLEYIKKIHDLQSSITLEQYKQKVLSDKKLSNDQKNYLITKAELENNIKNKQNELDKLKKEIDLLENNFGIRPVIDIETFEKYTQLKEQFAKANTEIINFKRNIESLDSSQLLSGLEPLKKVFSDGFNALGLGDLSDEFDTLFTKILDKQASFNEKFSAAVNLIGEYSKIMIQQQTEAQIAAYDKQIESSRNATEQELGFIDKRLEYYANMSELTAEQIADRNALEDEARVYREQQEQREKMIAMQKAKAMQRASAQQAIIGGLEGAAESIAKLGLPAGIPFAAASVAMGALMAGLIMSKNPVPQYFVGRKGGKAEFALTQERGAEAIISKEGEIKTFGDNKGAQMTWLDEGDSVLTASKTKQLVAQIKEIPDMDSSIYRKIARQGIMSPIIMNNNIDNSDAIAEKVGKEFDKVMNKYDKEYLFEKNGIIYSQKGGQIPVELGRAKKQIIQVVQNNRNVRI